MGSQPIDGIYTSPEIDVNNFMALSFHEGVGDHRTSIVDFSTSSFIGTYQGHIVRPTSRRLTTKQPQSVHNYNTTLLSHLTSHRIRERLLQIANDAIDTPGDPDLLQRSDNLFEEIKQYRLRSERGCRNILKPYSPFSLPVKYWYDRIHTLRDLIKLKEGKHKTMGKSRILRRATRLHIPTPALLSIDDCKEGIRLSLIQQREVRKQDDAHRSQHLGNCLQAAMDSGNEERIQKAKARIRNESSRKMWRRINRVTKPATGRACMQVEVERNGQVFSFTAKDDIELEIQSECQQRFNLGHSAPISRSRLGEELNYFANDSIAEQLISGTYPIPDDMDHPTALMITEIGRMGRLVRETGDRETISVLATDYQRYFHRINENTSSSPSGLHLGHDKAAAQCNELSEIFALQMSTIVHTGIHPSRWGVALQVMIEKIAGVCLVTKLRSIQLYEADYNWFNKFIFNDGALRALESSGLLPEEHYSQRNSTAEDACFDKTLTLDISRQSRTPMAIISVDAAQCYDRVNHRMMALVWLALQVPIQAVSIIVHCLQYMKIFTRTGWGDSTRYFGGNTTDTPFCGLGQGSKAAPASWIQLSSVIVNVYKSMGFGARIRDPVNGSESHTIGCLFVDDTDLYCLDENLSTIPQIAATASIQTSWWARLLNSTGGAIKGPKSFWYLLYYICEDGIWDYADTKETIEIPLPQDENTTLTSKHPSHAEKTLGVWTSPCGGHAAHLLVMQDKANGWLRSILNGHLPASHTWASYLHQLLPRLQYALGTLTNDLASAEQCLQSMEFKLLPHLGVNRHIKRGWRRTHQTFGGIGLLNLPIEQFICRINLFMQHYDTPSSLGHKLSASLHWLQLQIGCTGSPFLLPYATWEHLSPTCWAKCFWQSLDKFGVDLRVQYKSIPLQREGDLSVMEYLLPYMCSRRIMAATNRCRCYLHILLLSDITSLDGTRISSDMVWGNRPRLSSSLRFPPEQPTLSDWRIWSDIWIQATLPGLCLPSPLGRWETTPHYQWPWLFDDTRQELHVTSGGGPYTVYARQPSTVRTRSTQLFRPTAATTCVSEGTIVSVDCDPRPTGVAYLNPSSAGIWDLSPSHSGIVDFWDQVKSWGGLWMWEMIFPDVGLGFDVTWMISALRAGNLICVTDGSYDRQRSPNVCAAGWIIMDTATGSRLAGSFSEYSSSASSYRGELLGLCAINVVLLALSIVGNIDNRPQVTVWCDNKGAVNRASDQSRRIKCGRPCADILRLLRSIRQELHLSASYIHVKAHMDDKLRWEQLSLEQQLNCHCDTLAKSAVSRSLEHEHHHTSIGQLLPKESVGLYIHNRKITSDPANELRYLLGKTEAKRFLIENQGWTETTFEDTGWDWLHKVLASKPVMFRLWLSKQHSNFCATGMQTVRCGMSDDNRCPSCWQSKERAEHLCRCPSKSRTDLFLDNVSELEQWLTSHDNTEPELGYWLVKYIRGRGSLQFAELGEFSDDLATAARSQDAIGWRNMMEGRVSKHFYRIQRRHLSTAESRLNGDDWMKGLITRLLHISHSQWLFRNFTLHDMQCGYKRMKDKAEVQLRIAELSNTDPERIPDHSKFLLEIDTEQLLAGDFTTQVYWVTAMEAARHAPTVALTRGRFGPPPARSTFGAFVVREEIRLEINEMFGGQRTRTKAKPRGCHPDSANKDDAGHGDSGLTESDRRRKPD
jgi:hypothetical protein